MQYEMSAIHRHARVSPQKARLVADQIRGLSANEAIQILTFSKKSAAHLVKKVLTSAIANAEHNAGLDADELVVKAVTVDEGPRLKRFRARARGRANQIIKRTSHIKIQVIDMQKVFGEY